MENKLQEINKEAALNTSAALKKLIGQPVSVVISKPEVKDVKELSPTIGAEEIVAGVYLPISGDIQGAALLIFPKETTFTLSDLLVRRPPGTTQELTELDKSALKEVGNIITGNYFTVLGNRATSLFDSPGFVIAIGVDHRSHFRERKSSTEIDVSAARGRCFPSKAV